MPQVTMTSTTTPYEVFIPQIASRVKDTGDCWLWEGPVCSKSGAPKAYVPGTGFKVVVTSLAYRAVNDVTTACVKTVPSCEDPLCVHPEHLASVSSTVGTMLRIKKSSTIKGDCWVWEGALSGENSPRINRQVDGKLVQISVRRFVWSVEHGVPYVLDEKQFSTTCRTRLCVSFKHITLAERQRGDRVCASGHWVRSDEKECPECKHRRQLKRCPRGHTEAWYNLEGYKDGCGECNREDATQYLRDTARDFLARWS